MRISISLFICLFGSIEAQLCQDQQDLPPSLKQLTLYSSGTKGTKDYVHVLSTVANLSSLASTIGLDVKEEYKLEAMALDGNSECACAQELKLVYLEDKGYVTLSQSPPDDLTYYTTAGYTETPLPSFYCVTYENDCGATIPLYLYYDSNIKDYYVSMDGEPPSPGAIPYGFGLPPNKIADVAIPICYAWTFVNLTTTTMSTTMMSSTDVTSSDYVFLYDDDDNMTSSTVSQYDDVTDEYGSPVTKDPTASTLSSNASVTNAPGGQTGPETTTKESWKSKAKKWYKWPLIALGVLLGLGFIIALIACITVSFINPSPKTTTVVRYSDTSPQLPPPPVYSMSPPQPLTVGFPMGPAPPGVVPTVY